MTADSGARVPAPRGAPIAAGQKETQVTQQGDLLHDVTKGHQSTFLMSSGKVIWIDPFRLSVDGPSTGDSSRSEQQAHDPVEMQSTPNLVSHDFS